MGGGECERRVHNSPAAVQGILFVCFLVHVEVHQIALLRPQVHECDASQLQQQHPNGCTSSHAGKSLKVEPAFVSGIERNILITLQLVVDDISSSFGSLSFNSNSVTH